MMSLTQTLGGLLTNTTSTPTWMSILYYAAVAVVWFAVGWLVRNRAYLVMLNDQQAIINDVKSAMEISQQIMNDNVRLRKELDRYHTAENTIRQLFTADGQVYTVEKDHEQDIEGFDIKPKPDLKN